MLQNQTPSHVFPNQFTPTADTGCNNVMPLSIFAPLLCHTSLRPPRGVREAHLNHAGKPCFTAAIPSKTYANK